MITKLRRAIEMVWLLLAIFSLIAGIYQTHKTSIADSYPLFIITVVALMMFVFRRLYLRPRIENAQNQAPSNSDKQRQTGNETTENN